MARGNNIYCPDWRKKDRGKVAWARPYTPPPAARGSQEEIFTQPCLVLLQGDPLGCSLGVVDIKTKVAYTQYGESGTGIVGRYQNFGICIMSVCRYVCLCVLVCRTLISKIVGFSLSPYWVYTRKHNLCFDVNKTKGATWRVNLHVQRSAKKYANLAKQDEGRARENR